MDKSRQLIRDSLAAIRGIFSSMEEQVTSLLDKAGLSLPSGTLNGIRQNAWTKAKPARENVGALLDLAAQGLQQPPEAIQALGQWIAQGNPPWAEPVTALPVPPEIIGDARHMWAMGNRLLEQLHQINRGQEEASAWRRASSLPDLEIERTFKRYLQASQTGETFDYQAYATHRRILPAIIASRKAQSSGAEKDVLQRLEMFDFPAKIEGALVHRAGLDGWGKRNDGIRKSVEQIRWLIAGDDWRAAKTDFELIERNAGMLLQDPPPPREIVSKLPRQGEVAPLADGEDGIQLSAA